MFRLRCVVILAMLLCSLPLMAQKPIVAQAPAILPAEISSPEVPKLEASPKLSDFEGMEATTSLARTMLKVDKFLQRDPHDNVACSQRTEAYLGYTDKNLYVVFLAFDSEPQKIRARMLRRELIDDDDQVGMFLDTFNDQRHAYSFYSDLDAIVLGTGTRTVGTIDGVKSESAGKVSYTMPESGDPEQYKKLRQFVYEESWMRFGDVGDHIGPMTYRFEISSASAFSAGVKSTRSSIVSP